jgi:hypothetical protein
MKKQARKLKFVKETLQKLDARREPFRTAVGGTVPQDLAPLGTDDTRSVYWSCVCTGSGMYTCAC